MKTLHVKTTLLLCSLVILYACASDSYTYYGLNIVEINREELQKGRLLHKDPKKDLELTECLPTGRNKSPCVVLFSTEYFKAMRDIEELKVRLKACESGN